MYEIQIELIEVEEPNGEIVGVPYMTKCTKAVNNIDDCCKLFNKLVDTILLFEAKDTGENEKLADSKSSTIEVSIKDAQEYVDWAKDKAFCNSGQHICDRLANQFETELKQ